MAVDNSTINTITSVEQSSTNSSLTLDSSINKNKRNRDQENTLKKGKPKGKKFKEPPLADPISHEGVLITDIKSFLKSKNVAVEDVANDLKEFFSRPKGTSHPEHRSVLVKIEALSSIGEGLGLVEIPIDDSTSQETTLKPKYQVVVVPFTVVGDEVEAKIYKTQKFYFNADLIKVTVSSPKRNESLVNCKYFGKCSGCQYQMIEYKDQLEIKRNVIVNAYKHNSNLDPIHIPEIDETVGSPLKYNYRTKLTPHFDIPRKTPDTAPPVGFGQPGRKAILDIEECSIGTSVINGGLKKQRSWFQENFRQYKRGATFLLRENTVPKTDTERDDDSKNDTQEKDMNIVEKEKICSTSTKDIITEYVGDYVFTYPASSFFQNNNSILTTVTNYVRENIKLPQTGQPPTFLVDTYCGCGLFAITCCGKAEKVIGVEISQDSVQYARKNAKLNNVNAEFIVGQAEKIFNGVTTNPNETSIIIDPPRKGCDVQFLDQLLAFRPAKIVYVSCNVHSQARDIGYILNSEKGKVYQIESIRGFDFFPQTYHVESVAVLSLKY